MKKLLIIALLAYCSKGFAQHFSIGLKAGTNISNFIGGDFSDVKKKAKIGFYGGGYLNFWAGKNFSIQPEALISTQGVKIEDAGTITNYSLTYINVPIMLKYKSDGGFYFEAGPQAGFKISENAPDSILGGTVKDFFKNLDLSLGAGIGYHSNAGFGIGARYLVGLTKVGNFDPSLGDPNFKNSIIQIGLFYTIGTPKK
ncbi:MAG: PorT family protein [Chitinophagaceae bacterium]|nr:PorT family protein [Chitinophagaceae bacterium]